LACAWAVRFPAGMTKNWASSFCNLVCDVLGRRFGYISTPHHVNAQRPGSAEASLNICPFCRVCVVASYFQRKDLASMLLH
jgi:hypothetical protein